MPHGQRKKPLLHTTELSPGTRFAGTLKTGSSLLVRGRFSGTILSSSHVGIAKEAVLEDVRISAISVRAAGTVRGSVEAVDWIEVLPSARFEGTIVASEGSVSERADIAGTLKIGD